MATPTSIAAQPSRPLASFYTGPTVSRVPAPVQHGPKDQKAWKTAQDFEQMFMEQTLGQLTSGLTGEGPLGDEGAGADVWRGMLTQQYAKSITNAGGLGIASSVYSELMRIQEKSHVAG
jgi:Rod binding domain-containing protein